MLVLVLALELVLALVLVLLPVLVRCTSFAITFIIVHGGVSTGGRPVLPFWVTAPNSQLA